MFEFNYSEGICPNYSDGDDIPDIPIATLLILNIEIEYQLRKYKIEGSLQLIFKLPFIEDQRSMISFLFDFGNVFSDNCKITNLIADVSLEDLRYS